MLGVGALGLALASGVLAKRLRLPGGALLWALLAAAAATLAFSLEPLPRGVAYLGQLLLGGMLGAELARAKLGALWAYALPLAAGLVALVAVSLAGGVLLAAMTTLSLPGALLATMPGGAADAVVFANAAGSESFGRGGAPDPSASCGGCSRTSAPTGATLVLAAASQPAGLSSGGRARTPNLPIQSRTFYR